MKRVVLRSCFFALTVPYQDGRCCSYGAPSAQTQVDGFDCVQIPGAVNNGVNPADFLPRRSNLCGNKLGIPGNTVCSERACIPRCQLTGHNTIHDTRYKVRMCYYVKLRHMAHTVHILHFWAMG